MERIIGLKTSSPNQCEKQQFFHYSYFYSLLQVCQPLENDSTPNSFAMRMAMACYLYYINKFVEFADTFFFIARKKFRNVNKLQLIHHGIMPIYGFMIARWLPGGHETFGGMFNCFVHVIMYGYYFLGKCQIKSNAVSL